MVDVMVPRVRVSARRHGTDQRGFGPPFGVGSSGAIGLERRVTKNSRDMAGSRKHGTIRAKDGWHPSANSVAVGHPAGLKALPFSISMWGGAVGSSPVYKGRPEIAGSNPAPTSNANAPWEQKGTVMFIPTEAMGGIIARIAGETGFPPSSVVFEEDRLTVVFEASTPQKGGKRASVESVRTDYPVGPYVQTEEHKGRMLIWKCGEVKATIPELAEAFKVTSSCMAFRLTHGGMAATSKRLSKFDRSQMKKSRMAVLESGKGK